ncbi:MAG: hypothetical protein Ct9H300mP16_05950 [Pseudomonadota bacterium]|nr:MAG: hypothetical protein Ct9H300mP16_05950 [Pseudomonadota bacterium]
MNIAALLQKTARTFGESSAVSHGMQRCLTYSELAGRVERLAAVLVGPGFGPGPGGQGRYRDDQLSSIHGGVVRGLARRPGGCAPERQASPARNQLYHREFGRQALHRQP